MYEKSKIKVVLVVLALFTSLNIIVAQEGHQFNDTKHRIGFVSGLGKQIGSNITYDYQVLFFQIQYYYRIIGKKTWGMDILVQPQYNLTKFRDIDDVTDKIKGFEFGLNGGILIRKTMLADLLSLYAFISAGPHYVSATPQIQSDGFIFSDNFFAGLNIRMRKNTYLDLRAGLRHISNAGIKSPNEGINNLVLSAGLFVNIQSKQQLTINKR